MPAAFNDREREEIRSRLMAAALDALGRGGLSAASVSDLARAADIAKGSFYAFFPTKEHLFMEALESLEDRYREGFTKAAEGPGAPVERLERAFQAAFDLVETEPAVRRLDMRTAERLARALPPERVEEHVARDSRALETVAALWRSQGLLAEGIGSEDLAASGYAIFLAALGLTSLPESARTATKRVLARGLALALAASGDGKTRERGGKHDRG